MRIDRTHRGWLVATVIGVIAAMIVYVPYATNTPGGPRGDTWIGLAYGVVSAALIVFAGLLALRKKVLLLRVGSVAGWMHGHLWLGVLALLLVFFHAGFAFGGTLTTALVWLAVVVVVTGVFGAALQHAMPAVMTSQVERECTFEQIDRVRLQLRRDAYALITAASGPPLAAAGERETLELKLGVEFRERAPATVPVGADVLCAAYIRTVLPYLRGEDSSASLADPTARELFFDQLRPQLDPSLHGALDELASICATFHQWKRQVRLHHWLHGWLLVHVPASFALLLLMIVHAVMALYY